MRVAYLHLTATNAPHSGAASARAFDMNRSGLPGVADALAQEPMR